MPPVSPGPPLAGCPLCRAEHFAAAAVRNELYGADGVSYPAAHRHPGRTRSAGARTLSIFHVTPVPVISPGRQVDDLSGTRSEEHTSELQSRENLVCRLLLDKK